MSKSETCSWSPMNLAHEPGYNKELDPIDPNYKKLLDNLCNCLYLDVMNALKTAAYEEAEQWEILEVDYNKQQHSFFGGLHVLERII